MIVVLNLTVDAHGSELPKKVHACLFEYEVYEETLTTRRGFLRRATEYPPCAKCADMKHEMIVFGEGATVNNMVA